MTEPWTQSDVSTVRLVIVAALVTVLVMVAGLAFLSWIAGPDCWERDSRGRKIGYDYARPRCGGD